VIHAPHVESYDVAAKTNIVRTGGRHPLKVCEVSDAGLFIARSIPNHPRLAGMRSWLLPELGLRITAFTRHARVTTESDYYIDICEITIDRTVWTTIDHYLDILLWDGRYARVVDSDEFVLAVRKGLLSPADAERALETTHRTLAGLAEHNYRLDAWLGSLGITLHWPTPQ
jgi:hypothetical protein